MSRVTRELSTEDVAFHPLSFFDQHDRLFRWNGGLYRAVDPGREAFYSDAFASGLIPRLVKRGLIIETSVSELRLAGSLVLKHRELPLVSYPFEWCPEMLRQAALLTINLERELERANATVSDVHGFNIVFDGTSPTWVDLGALTPRSGDGSLWFAQFEASFARPLRLVAAGKGRIARWLLHDRFGLGASDLDTNGSSTVRAAVASLLRQEVHRTRVVVPTRLRRAARTALETRRAVTLDTLEHELQHLDLSAASGSWSGYYDWFTPVATTDEQHAKELAVEAIIRSLAPQTVLDVGSNRGHYSLLAARLGAAVAAIDSDERSVSELYLQAHEEGLAVQALLADFRHLSMGYGPGVNLFAPVSERLRADLVLALALVHHLVLDGLDFEQIVAGLASFAGNALLVEFVPVGDQHAVELHTQAPPWYELDRFLAVLRTKFPYVEVMASHPEPRILVLCTRTQ